MVLTRLAVLLATSLADCTKCLLATGLAVLDEASRQALHSAEVCLATMVAAESTCNMHILIFGLKSADDAERNTTFPRSDRMKLPVKDYCLGQQDFGKPSGLPD